jgi:hypothetical protein
LSGHCPWTPCIYADAVSDNLGKGYDDIPVDPSMTGYDNLREGTRLFQSKRYDEASVYLWRAVLMQEQSSHSDSVRLFYYMIYCADEISLHLVDLISS